MRRINIARESGLRMASNGNAKAERNDPENQLFSRQNRRRLEAEAIRDAILTASGRLIPAQEAGIGAGHA